MVDIRIRMASIREGGRGGVFSFRFERLAQSCRTVLIQLGLAY